MKKTTLLLTSLFFILGAVAQQNSHKEKDNQIAEVNHKLNFSFSWFELGASVPLNEKKLLKLPYGMNHYLYGPKGGLAGALFGIGLYYKNHWGISAILSFQDYYVPSNDFKKYVISQYPGRSIDGFAQAHAYSLNNINYRIGYRFHKNRFIFEPQFQLGINDYNDFQTHFILKEKGSNNFVEYDIKQENRRKNIVSYRAALITRWQFSKPGSGWNLEPGLRVELLVIPTNFNYTITSGFYNTPPTVQEVTVKQMHPAISITAVMGFFKK